MSEVISFPIDLAGMYGSSRHVDRMELLLESFDGITKFFNIYCAVPITRLINEDIMDEYIVGNSENDDSIVFNRVSTQCYLSERDEEDRFSNYHLDNLGVSLSELRSQIKAGAVYLIECGLGAITDHVLGEAKDRGLRLDNVLNITASHELTADRGLPVTLIVEVELSLDEYRN